jgi:hypothetical protein
VRREDDVALALELRDEAGPVGLGLLGEDVDGGAADAAFGEREGEGVDVDDGAARGVEEEGPVLHPVDLVGAHHAAGLRRLGDVQGDEVGLGEQGFEAVDGAVVAHRQARGDVVEDDPHAHRLGEHAHLRADVAVAHDAERLAAHLDAAGRELLSTRPCASRCTRSPRWRESTTISAMISSATLRVLEKGALNTGTPRALARSRAIWLVPMQKAPITRRSGSASRTFGVSRVLLRIPRPMQPAAALIRSSSGSAFGRSSTSKPSASRFDLASGWIPSTSSTRPSDTTASFVTTQRVGAVGSSSEDG